MTVALVPHDARLALLPNERRNGSTVDNVTLLKSSKSNEWYTPSKYIEAVREVLGEIELDPASCRRANQTVRAHAFHSLRCDGLSRPWASQVFLNPPYGGKQKAFISKLMRELDCGNVREAIVVVSAYSTETKWFRPLWDGTLCFVHGRIRWDNPAGRNSSATIGSVFIYFGPYPDKFAQVFSRFGAVMSRYKKEYPDAILDRSSSNQLSRVQEAAR